MDIVETVINDLHVIKEGVIKMSTEIKSFGEEKSIDSKKPKSPRKRLGKLPKLPIVGEHWDSSGIEDSTPTEVVKQELPHEYHCICGYTLKTNKVRTTGKRRRCPEDKKYLFLAIKDGVPVEEAEESKVEEIKSETKLEGELGV